MASHCRTVWSVDRRRGDGSHFRTPNSDIFANETQLLDALLHKSKSHMEEYDWILLVPAVSVGAPSATTTNQQPTYYIEWESLLEWLQQVRLHTFGNNSTTPAGLPLGVLRDFVAEKNVDARKAVATCFDDRNGDYAGGLWNRHAVSNVLSVASPKALPDFVEQLQVRSPCQLMMTVGEDEKVLEPPFTHIQVPTSSIHNTTTHAWRRLHAILHGSCNIWWRRVPYGALDAEGNQGYVHDAKAMRRVFYLQPNRLNLSQAHCDTTSAWHNATRHALNKVVVAPNPPVHRRQRVLCMVYTHSGRHAQIAAVHETWGPHCDGFFAASNVTDPALGTVNLLHDGPESYDNMWLKVRSMWEYAHAHYLHEYDFFHIGGDDHYLVPENLRWMVSVAGGPKGVPWNHDQPLFLGGPVAFRPLKRYCGGGSGYTLNRAALDVLVTQLWWRPSCFPYWQGPEEDIMISRCFGDMDLQCMDTNDELEETRYHPWDAAFHSRWTHAQKANWWPRYLEQQGIQSKDGMGQISNTSVAFHLKQLGHNSELPLDSGMRFYHAILYRLCPNAQESGVVRVNE